MNAAFRPLPALVVAVSAPSVLAVDDWLPLSKSPTTMTTSDALAMLIVGTATAFALSIVQETVAVARLHRTLVRSLMGDR